MLLSAITLVTASLASLTTATVPAWDDWPHGRVALKDVGIHFRYAGSGPPLLLVHGNPQHSVSLQFIILSQAIDIFYSDHVAHPRSPPSGKLHCDCAR